MLKISYPNWFGLSLAILAQFTFEMHVAARNREKFTKTRYFVGSRSFKVIDIDISKKLNASACYDKQHVCAYLQLFSPSGKITLFKGGAPSFAPSFEGNPCTQWHEILSP